jgi:hypothetical protein
MALQQEKSRTSPDRIVQAEKSRKCGGNLEKSYLREEKEKELASCSG